MLRIPVALASGLLKVSYMLFWMRFFSPRGIQDFQICNEELRRNLIFRAQILLLNTEFRLSLPLVLFLFSQIFLYFCLNCGSRNIGNNDKQSGETVMGGSHGCTAMSYLPGKFRTFNVSSLLPVVSHSSS